MFTDDKRAKRIRAHTDFHPTKKSQTLLYSSTPASDFAYRIVCVGGGEAVLVAWTISQYPSIGFEIENIKRV